MTKRKIEGQFAMVPQRALRELYDSPLNVYIALCLRANSETSTCYPSWNRIADDTGLCRSAIHRALKKLAADGWITKIQRGSNLKNRANLYEVHQAPCRDSVPGDTMANADSASGDTMGSTDSVPGDTMPNSDSASGDTIDSVPGDTMASVPGDTLTYQSKYQLIYQHKVDSKSTQDTIDVDYVGVDVMGDLKPSATKRRMAHQSTAIDAVDTDAIDADADAVDADSNHGWDF